MRSCGRPAPTPDRGCRPIQARVTVPWSFPQGWVDPSPQWQCQGNTVRTDSSGCSLPSPGSRPSRAKEPAPDRPQHRECSVCSNFHSRSHSILFSCLILHVGSRPSFARQVISLYYDIPVVSFTKNVEWMILSE